MKNDWEIIIGIETHIQLATKSKLFSGSKTCFGEKPNANACMIDLGLPGTLPVLNAKALEMAIKFGLSINAEIATKSIFARKNYFYPDLPKGYQISQYEHPIIKNGYLDIELNNKSKRINIINAHLEEDSGKLIHESFPNHSGIDFNRAGIPLIEIVSAPDLRSANETIIYLKTLHNLIRYLDISTCNMQEGAFRCDANISVRPHGQKTLNPRAEIKNLNSLRLIKYAIEYEAARQIAILEKNGEIIQDTRFYDPIKNETHIIRNKENAIDYRYFSDPDLLPIILSNEYIEKIRATLPELPQEKCYRFRQQYALSKYDAALLTTTREMAEYFEDTMRLTKAPSKLAANWITGELLAALNKTNIDISQSSVSPKQLAELLDEIHNQTISGKIAKEVFSAMLNNESSAKKIIAQRKLTQITDKNELLAIITNIIDNNQKQIKEYQSGKIKLFDYFVGQIMKETQGKANPKQVNKLLKEKLD